MAVSGGRETGQPGLSAASAVENGITSQPDGFLLEHAGKPATSLHQFLPLEFSIDEYLGWNGQLAEIPVQGTALERRLGRSDHRNQVEVAADSRIAPSVGPKVTNAQ